ncbi:hypothetical protein VTK56DRAFT_8943 [Thermocarpiscus australiensis]
MARIKDLERIRAVYGDPLVMLARMRVPLDQPLPPPYSNRNDTVTATGEVNPGNPKWKDSVAVLENARGCEFVACSRIAENPELVLFVIVWWDQKCLDKFRASPDYTVFLVSLGMLDLPEPQAGGTSSSFRTIQTVKFLSASASNDLYLRGWLSFFTVTLAHPVTDAQRDMFRRLRGPHYPPCKDDDIDMRRKLNNLPESTKFPNLQHGWAQELREITGGGEGKASTVVQDGVFYKMWFDDFVSTLGPTSRPMHIPVHRVVAIVPQTPRTPARLPLASLSR